MRTFVTTHPCIPVSETKLRKPTKLSLEILRSSKNPKYRALFNANGELDQQKALEFTERLFKKA